MIQFACACGKKFSVPDDYAGRAARCKNCGATVTVPARQDKIPVRTRRLMADAEQMTRKFAACDYAKVILTTGDPPELYQVRFNVRSIEKTEKDKPIFRDEHVVEIQLTS